MIELTKNEADLQRYLDAVVAHFEELEIYPRNVLRYPFDYVALELLSKAISICRSCLILLRNDQPEEAFALGRSLVEIRLILRHLTRDKTALFVEAWVFLNFSFTDKNFWLFHVRRVANEPEVIEDANRLADEWNLSDKNPMAATRPWSNKYNAWGAQKEEHPLDGSTNTQSHRASSFAVEYTQASFFVHCTQPSLDNYFPDSGTPFKVKPSTQQYLDAKGTNFFQIITSVHEIVRYVLYGLNLDTPHTLVGLYGDIILLANH